MCEWTNEWMNGFGFNFFLFGTEIKKTNIYFNQIGLSAIKQIRLPTCSHKNIVYFMIKFIINSCQIDEHFSKIKVGILS